jgi:hypothetical protein
MATYTFVNTTTGEVEEHVMRMTEYDNFKESNPHLERYFESAAAISYNGRGDLSGGKTDNTWKEVLTKIAEQNPRSPLADRVLKKDQRRIATDQIIQKHAKKQAEALTKKP